jgi:hypothetical protein
LWRYFLDNEKTFRFFGEDNGIEGDPLSEVRKRLLSYLEQYIINEAGVIKSEEKKSATGIRKSLNPFN